MLPQVGPEDNRPEKVERGKVCARNGEKEEGTKSPVVFQTEAGEWPPASVRGQFHQRGRRAVRA